MAAIFLEFGVILIRSIFIIFGLIIILFSGCGIQQNHGVKTQVNSNNQQIREEVKQKIDGLESYQTTEIKGLTWGTNEFRKFRPNPPKEFSAGMFKVTFQNGNDEKEIVLQTELKVAHGASVIPGKTRIDGYISYYEDIDKNSLYNYAGLMLNKKEQEYFIQMLYKKFNKPMKEEEAENLNKVKDYALAIYFNGEPGIEAFHKK